jgi:hypothetical protein
MYVSDKEDFSLFSSEKEKIFFSTLTPCSDHDNQDQDGDKMVPIGLFGT